MLHKPSSNDYKGYSMFTTFRKLGQLYKWPYFHHVQTRAWPWKCRFHFPVRPHSSKSRSPKNSSRKLVLCFFTNIVQPKQFKQWEPNCHKRVTRKEQLDKSCFHSSRCNIKLHETENLLHNFQSITNHAVTVFYAIIQEREILIFYSHEINVCSITSNYKFHLTLLPIVPSNITSNSPI